MQEAPFPLLCVIVHHVCDCLEGLEPVAVSDIVDEAKGIAARASLRYHPYDIGAAVEAVLVARAKGYYTPRRMPEC